MLLGKEQHHFFQPLVSILWLSEKEKWKIMLKTEGERKEETTGNSWNQGHRWPSGSLFRLLTCDSERMKPLSQPTFSKLWPSASLKQHPSPLKKTRNSNKMFDNKLLPHLHGVAKNSDDVNTSNLGDQDHDSSSDYRECLERHIAVVF